jgi:acetyl esterase/lipase
MVPWLFLAATLVGAWFTFNAYLPERARGPLIVGSFFAGWLTSELSHHHFAWQLVATGVFVGVGALEAWPGWLGLGITLVSWAGLLGLSLRAWRSREVVEVGLCEGLGSGYRAEIAPDLSADLERPLPWSRQINPFLLYDPAVRRVKNLVFAPEHGFRGKLDLYLPADGASGAPVLFQIHGGAWTVSQKAHQALPLMLHLARAGWVCVAPNYRLSPRATWPDHVVDVKRALAWVREHIADYGGDPEFVAATGGSAGGHLSALVGLTGNDPAFQPGFEEADTRVQACVPFYGVYDFTDHHSAQLHDGLQKMLERVVMKSSLASDREVWEQASPLHRIHPDAPPFLVVHGTHDSLTPVEEARLFVELLRKTSQEPVCYAEIPGAQHAFEVFYSLRSASVVRGVERFLGWVWSRHREGRGAAPQAPQASGSETTSITT